MQILLASGGQSLIGTFNPADKNASITLSNNNLTMTTPSASSTSVRSTNSYATGQRFFEVTLTSLNNSGNIGVGLSTASLSARPGLSAGSVGLDWSGNIQINGSSFVASGLGALSTGDVIGVQLDADADTVAFNRNGGSYSSPTAMTSTSSAWFIMSGNLAGGAASITLNLTPVYGVPSGYTLWGN